MKQIFTFISITTLTITAAAQTRTGYIKDADTQEPVAGATIQTGNKLIQTISDKAGKFTMASTAGDTLFITAIGYNTLTYTWTNDNAVIVLNKINQELEDVVIAGTMRPVTKAASPIAVEVYSPSSLKKIPPPVYLNRCRILMVYGRN